MDIKQSIKEFPLTSGVYLMKDSTGLVLYVGKAVSLKNRIQSYFNKYQDAKTQALVKKIHHVDYVPTASEAEALILEASLIKQFKPKYNIELRDDKSYPFIQITKEKFPLVSVVRPNSKKAVQKKTVEVAKENRHVVGLNRRQIGVMSRR